jgi:hypothetical protein
MKVTLIGIDLATKTTKKTAMIAQKFIYPIVPTISLSPFCDVVLVLRKSC